MKTKRMISLLLAVLLTLSVAVTPAFAASAGDLLPAAESADVEESNDVVSIRLTTSGELVYGSPFTLSVVTKPADTQYIGVVIGTKGEAKGYVTLVLSDKIRTLLKMIPLPRKMSATPDQQEEFNLYAYIKQLIDGNDVSVLLRVADEVVSVMDVLQFYMPTIKDVSTGLKLALALIRKFLPDGAFSRIYVDEQPTESGNYVAGAVALESGDVNTAGVAMFRIKPKTEGVRTYWTQEVPDTMTVEEAQNYDLSAVLEVDGQQFITLVSKSGATFYLVIDRNAKGQQTVHFMNLVDEADLLALMEEEDAEAYNAEKEAVKQAELDKLKAEEEAKKAAEEAEKAADVPKENKMTKYAAAFLGVVALIALAAGGGFYFFIQQKNKKQAEKEAIDPDADYTEDTGDFEIPPEDDSEDEDTSEEQDVTPI